MNHLRGGSVPLACSGPSHEFLEDVLAMQDIEKGTVRLSRSEMSTLSTRLNPTMKGKAGRI